MQVAVREFKSSLSRVLSLAQAGEVIEVTSHGKPIARIIGIPPQADEGLRRLMASGLLTWNGGKPTFSPIRLRASEGKPIAQMVLEDRG
jgi:prevent-host-death family protein